MTEHPAPSHGPDTSGAYRGLILGAIILFIVLYTIVRLTAHHYDAREAAQKTPSQQSQ